MVHVWEDERDKPNFEITGQDRGKNVLYGHRIDDPKTKIVRVGVKIPAPNKQYLKIQSGKEVYEQEAHSPVLNYYIRVISYLAGAIQTDGRLFRWNNSNSWVQVAGQLGAETEIFCLKVY